MPESFGANPADGALTDRQHMAEAAAKGVLEYAQQKAPTPATEPGGGHRRPTRRGHPSTPGQESPHKKTVLQDIIQDYASTPLPWRHIEICELAIPQVEPFRSAIGVRHERRALYVRCDDGEGHLGIGECSCRPDPYFSGEFVAGAWQVLTDFVAPSLGTAGTFGDLAQAVGRIRGWPFTTAAVLDAASDLLRRRGTPDLLDRWPEAPLERIPVGISLGLFETPQVAVDRVQRAVDDGYHRVKLKVAPSMQVGTVEAIREAFPELHLGFDANGSCGGDDLPLIRRLAALSPHVFEQPFAPDRVDLCLELKQLLPGLRICLDESVTGFGSLAVAHRLGALDEVNIKPGRIGGPVVTLEVLELCRRLALPAWVGGMFESGVGRHANLRLAARLPAALAHDLSPSKRYFSRDILAQDITMDSDGYVDLGEQAPPSIDEDTFDQLTVRRTVLMPSRASR